MATIVKSECTCNLNAAAYGMGDTVQVSWSSPAIADISYVMTSDYLIEGETASDFTVTDIDTAPMITGKVTVTQEIGGTKSSLYSETLTGMFWGFNAMAEPILAEQDYSTVAKYALTAGTLTFAHITCMNIKTGRTVTREGVALTTAIKDSFTLVRGDESESFGSPDRDVLFIPYKNLI